MHGFGIDLGTANTVISHTKHGVVLDEPSVMVMRLSRRRAKPMLVGSSARELIGRTPEGLVVTRPLHDGVVTDLDLARTYIRAVLRRLPAWRRIAPRAVIGVPVGATTLERKALFEAAHESRIAQATLIPEPIAGAIGCGIDPLEARTHMVVDVGGGTAEVTALCYGRVVTHRSCRVAGDEMTFAIYEYLRQVHQLIVGELVAEDLKIRAATEESPSIIVEGRDAATGRPRLVTLAIEEVTEAIQPVAETIISTLRACLEDLPAQSVSDINAEGVTMFGGGSLLRGFDKMVEEALGFTVRRAEQPLTCVAEGAAMSLRRPELLRAYGGR